MNEIVKFDFEENVVRTITIDGEPWFILKDICNVLGIQNPSSTVTQLDDDEKTTLSITKGGPERNIVNESGLYSVILMSRKPEAKKFKKWITSEVLPSIRKTGNYSVNQKPLSQSEMFLQSAQLLVKLEKKQNVLEERISKIETQKTEAEENLKFLPQPSVEAEEKTTRQALNKLINLVAVRDHLQYYQIREALYKEFSIIYHVNVRLQASKQNMKQIDWIETHGYIEELYSLSVKMFIKK